MNVLNIKINLQLFVWRLLKPALLGLKIKFVYVLVSWTFTILINLFRKYTHVCNRPILRISWQNYKIFQRMIIIVLDVLLHVAYNMALMYAKLCKYIFINLLLNNEF